MLQAQTQDIVRANRAKNHYIRKGLYYGANISILAISKAKPRFPGAIPLPWTGPGEPLEQFTLFPKLPKELRMMIWTEAIGGGRTITFETKEKSTIDGKIETYPGENFDRHEKMIASTSRSPFENSDKNMDSGEDESSSFPLTLYITHRANPILRTRPPIPATPMNIAWMGSDSHKSKLKVQSGTNEQKTLGGQPYQEYTAIDAAIARFREDQDEKKTFNTLTAPSSTNTPSSDKAPTLTGEVAKPQSAIAPNTSLPEPVIAENLPAILQVNKESRALSLKHFTLTLDKQHDGKPIYINYSRDEFRVQDIRTLQVLCGLNQSERFLQTGTGGMAEERNDPENMLRFLRFVEVVEDRKVDSLSLIARFRNLEMITLKKEPRIVRPDGSLANYHRAAKARDNNWIYRDTSIIEGKLKELWRKDDEKRGMQCTPNKTPEFKFLDNPPSSSAPRTMGHSQPGTFGIFRAAPPRPLVRRTEVDEHFGKLRVASPRK